MARPTTPCADPFWACFAGGCLPEEPTVTGGGGSKTVALQIRARLPKSRVLTQNSIRTICVVGRTIYLSS